MLLNNRCYRKTYYVYLITNYVYLKEKNRHIYFYINVYVSQLKNFPAFQIVSAKQDASIINYFFFEIIKDDAPTSRIVVIEFGKAILLTAVARIFANCIDLNNYIQICYNIISICILIIFYNVTIGYLVIYSLFII